MLVDFRGSGASIRSMWRRLAPSAGGLLVLLCGLLGSRVLGCNSSINGKTCEDLPSSTQEYPVSSPFNRVEVALLPGSIP